MRPVLLALLSAFCLPARAEAPQGPAAGPLTPDQIFDLPSQMTLRDSRSVFGSHNVASVVSRTEPAPHTDARGVLAINKDAFGSGIDGAGSAASADFAVLLQSRKSNWLASTQAGEIDGLSLIARQGRKGDAASLLFNGQKIGGTAEDTGGMTGLEGELRWLTPAEVPTLGMHLTMGILEGKGGPSGGTGNGFVAEASLGAPFAAFYGGGMPSGTTWPQWRYLLWGSSTRDTRDVYTFIDSAGNQFLKGNLTLGGVQIDSHSYTPSSSSSDCEVGQRAWNADYEYRCVAKNQWKRAALSTW